MHGIGFLLLGLLGGVGTGIYVNRAGMADPALKPTIGGFPAPTLLGVAGLAAAVFGGSILGPIGLGMAIGSIVSGDAINQTKTGIDAWLAKQAAGGGGGGAAPLPPALPGPAPQQGGGGWLSMLRQGAGMARDAFQPAAQA